VPSLNDAVARAVEQFERERDRVIETQNEKHFGLIAHELRNPLGSARWGQRPSSWACMKSGQR
jgi:signal transduction histidine kinase